MRKSTRILTILLAAVITVLALSLPALAVDVSIDGKKVTYTADSGSPFIDSASRTQVPFRQTLETFGATVSWDSVNKYAIAEKNGVQVTVPIGKNYIYRDGVTVQNDTAALIRNGRTYLPIRVVLEAFGYTVSWNSGTKTVIAVSSGGTEVTIHIIDVGQGDSIFIDAGSKEVLIDAGTASAGEKVSAYIRPYVDGDLELVIATHIHADHIGGLPAIYRDYQVEKTVYSGEQATTAAFKKFFAAMTGEPASSYMPDADMVLDLGCATLNIIELLDNDSNSNNNSVCALLTCGSFRFLTDGDGEAAAESALRGRVSDVDVWKAGHHGSATANTEALLSVIRPEYTVISCGQDNSYQHPHAAALRILLRYGTVYSTAVSGTVVITTNGSTYSVSPGRPLTEADAGDIAIYQPEPPAPPVSATGSYVGNSNSLVFHTANCSHADRISDKNRVTGLTREQLIANGYTPCSVCKP